MSEQSMHDMTGWQRVPCVVSDLILASGEVAVHAGLTDSSEQGVHYREWGYKDTPILRDYLWGYSDRDCEHYVPQVLS